MNANEMIVGESYDIVYDVDRKTSVKLLKVIVPDPTYENSGLDALTFYKFEYCEDAENHPAEVRDDGTFYIHEEYISSNFKITLKS